MEESGIQRVLRIAAAVVTVVGLWSTTAQAAPTAEQKCQAAKNQAASK